MGNRSEVFRELWPWCELLLDVSQFTSSVCDRTIFRLQFASGSVDLTAGQLLSPSATRRAIIKGLGLRGEFPKTRYLQRNEYAGIVNEALGYLRDKNEAFSRCDVDNAFHN